MYEQRREFKKQGNRLRRMRVSRNASKIPARWTGSRENFVFVGTVSTLETER